jgi:Tfp pilus assembly PilM family ATPase
MLVGVVCPCVMSRTGDHYLEGLFRGADDVFEAVFGVGAKCSELNVIVDEVSKMNRKTGLSF